MKVIQTNCIQTKIDDHTGEFLGYRLTLPVPKEWTATVDPKFILNGRKNSFFVVESKVHRDIVHYKLQVQISVNAWKIQQLQKKHISLRSKLAYL